MTDTTDKLTAAIFSLLMVVSALALGLTGAVAMPSDGEYQDASANDFGDVNAQEINPTLEQSEAAVGPLLQERLAGAEEGDQLNLILNFERAGDRLDSSLSQEQAVAALKSHADRTQAPAVGQLRSLDNVEIRNQLWLGNMIAISAPATDETISTLRELPGVQSVSLDRELQRPEPVETSDVDPEQDDYTYGLEQINIPEVWDEFDTQGEGAAVSIIDDSTNAGHPDIDVFTEDPSDPTYPGGFVALDSNGDPIPGAEPDGTGTGHGVHTSGTATAAADPADDSIPSFGVAPEADLHNVDVFRDTPLDTVIVAGMQWSADQGVDVVSASLGLGCSLFNPEPGYSDAHIDGIQDLNDAGIAFVSSAGNGEEGCVSDPGSNWDTISIGASDDTESIAGFSSGSLIDKDTGQPDYSGGGWEDPPAEWPQSWVAPYVSAPGVGVLSAGPLGGSGQYSEASGTSMAAPHAAGVIALMRSVNPDATVDEIEDALEATAFKPDGWDEGDARFTNSDSSADQEGIDSRYGYGIIDAQAALSELGPPVPEFDMGDVNEDGERSIVDVVLIQQHLAGVNVSINENLADVDRSGDVSVVDVVFLQQFLAGQISDGEMVIDNLDAPDSVPGGDTVTVTADLENVGGLGMFGQADFRLAETEDGLDDPNATLATNHHELAPAGSGNHTATTTFEIDTSGVPGGEYHHGVFSGDHNATDTITVTQPFFDVTGLDAPAEVVEDSEITVNATIENTGNEETTQTVEFQFAGSTLLTEDVTLAPNESTQVTFEPTVAADPGTYEHGVFTNDDSMTANITVVESVFSVSNVDGPTDLVHGDEITVNATVENTGDAADEQTIEYELGAVGAGKNVAIVSPAASSEGGDDAVQTILTNRLGDDYTIEQINSEDLLSEIENYDIFVVLRFGTNDGDSDGDSRASDFYSQLGDRQGAIYMDTETGATDAEYSNAISRLHRVEGITDTYTDDPEDDGKTLEITEDHPLFSGVGSAGDTFDPVTEDGFSDYASSWTGYGGGTPIADLQVNGEQAIGVSDDGFELLLANVAPDFFKSEPSGFTEDGKTVMSNAVEFVATGGVSGSATADSGHTETVQLDPGESAEVTFDYTVTADDGIGDVAHTVSSNDDDGVQGGVSVTAPDQIDITDYSAPVNATQTDTITAEATLEHVGTENTTQTLTFDFGGGLLQIEEDVTMSPGETMTVPLTATIPKTLDPGEYTHTASLKWDEADATLEVLEGDEANFAVNDLSAPPEAGQFDTFNVSATIENTGDFEDTQTVEYEFDIDAGDDPGDDPGLEEVSVAYVDSTRDSGSTNVNPRELYAQELRQATDLSESEIQTRVEQIDPDDHDADVDNYIDTLRSNLDSDVFTIDEINSANLLDNMDYDVYVIQQFDDDQGSDPPNPNPRVNDFLDQLGDEQGVVYLDQWSNWRADGVVSLGQNTDRLTWERDFGNDPQQMEILQDHPMFEGVGSAGDTVTMQNEDNSLWFNDYDGTVIGDNPTEDGAAVGVHEGRNEVIMTPAAPSASVGFDLISNDSKAMAANAVVWSAEQALLDGASATASEGDIVTIDGQPVKITATEQVTLDGGESTTVEFEFQVPGNLPAGTYGHGVSSEDDDATAEIFVFEQSPNIEVTGHFPEDDELSVGEDLVTEATVVNSGDVAGDRDIRLNVNGQVRDVVTVSLDPGEVRQLTLSTTMTQAGDFVVSVNGQDPQLITVTDNSTATTMDSVGVAAAG